MAPLTPSLGRPSLVGAHRAPDETIDLVGKVVSEALADLAQLDADSLRARRQEKFLAMGKKGL